MLWWKRRKALSLIESFVEVREERYACLDDKDYIGAEWAWECEETVYLEMCDLLGVESIG
jgi:hypothetical protein